MDDIYKESEGSGMIDLAHLGRWIGERLGEFFNFIIKNPLLLLGAILALIFMIIIKISYSRKIDNIYRREKKYFDDDGKGDGSRYG